MVVLGIHFTLTCRLWSGGMRPISENALVYKNSVIDNVCDSTLQLLSDSSNHIIIAVAMASVDSS